ncbi:MAG: outer membrane lipoprotein chaperone LolA [Desulfovibrio sp.]|nr:outer membrane lipoprotein chaperone LolA [Desulfovibrio sp.]
MLRFLSHSVLAILLVMAFSSFALADSLTERIQSHYKTMKGFGADFTQTLAHRESGTNEKRQGSILFAKPLKLRWETKKPHEELLIATSECIWQYIPDESLAYKYNASIMKDANSIIQVITGQSDLMHDFEVKRTGLDQGLQKLKLYPKTPTTQLVEADIWVDSDRGVIMKSVSMDFYGNTNTIVFENYTENVTPKSSMFSFTPPKGVEVEDKQNETEGKTLFQ